jgi:AcrR family transcriptional regulator
MARTEPDTRQRIMDAAVETLRDEGITGTTARAIARRGGFNQALIFYHFGSVANLLMQAFARTSDAQVEKYREAAAGVSSLQDLVGIARRLHADDEASGAITAVTQLMAAAASEPEVGAQILDGFEGWIALVQDALERATATSPVGAFVPSRQAAYAIAAMFLGIELMTRLDPERSEADALFDMMGALAGVAETLSQMLPSGD